MRKPKSKQTSLPMRTGSDQRSEPVLIHPVPQGFMRSTGSHLNAPCSYGLVSLAVALIVAQLKLGA
jgi:hypothetical protein